MVFPQTRLRRLRQGEVMRKLVRETVLSPSKLVCPLFVSESIERPEPIASMPGCYRHTLSSVVEEVGQLVEMGIRAFLLFGLPATKDELGASAYRDEGIVQRAVRKLKESFDEIVLITDVCLCQYTSHAHCGILKGKEVANDATLEVLSKVALSHARAGADVVAPSDMMDGRVRAIRSVLDANGYHMVGIMAYSAKYASSFYGPFRDAAGSVPAFGDRRSYQMDPANALEALREARLDIEEGADIIMVKPALAYLDVIRLVKDELGFPTAAFNVSGEYAMIKAAVEKGAFEERAAVEEVVTAIFRAGADIVITYHAKELAKRWKFSK